MHIVINWFIKFLIFYKKKPSIILIVQFHNEIERLPNFFTNVLPHVDGIIGLNDGSFDGSAEYFLAQPKVLELIHRPIRKPHVWDEPSNRQALIKASHQYRPEWILALDVDERLEIDFREKIERSIWIANILGKSVISFRLLELWDNENNYRIDGIWGSKRRNRLFRWIPSHQVKNVAFHGSWLSVEHHLKRGPFRSNHRIYHLGNMTEALRIKRIEKYCRLDSNNEFQPIGYDYLNEKSGLRIRSIRKEHQSFVGPLDRAPVQNLQMRLCLIFFKRIFTSDTSLSLEGNKKISHKEIILWINACISLIPPPLGVKSIPSLIISGWARTGKTTLASQLCRSTGMGCLSLDQFSAVYEGIRDEKTRSFIRSTLIKALICRFPVGIILEGSNLVFDNYYRSYSRPVPSLSLLHSLYTEYCMRVYIIGNTQDSIDEKMAAIKLFRQRHECWTSKSLAWANNNLDERVREVFQASQNFLSLAQINGLHYIDIQSNDFSGSIVRAQAHIEQDIVSPFDFAGY